LTFLFFLLQKKNIFIFVVPIYSERSKLIRDLICSLQVSEYLKKQMTAVEGQDSDELKNMLAENDKLVEEIFQHEDKDKNGFISHDEFSGPKHDEL